MMRTRGVGLFGLLSAPILISLPIGLIHGHFNLSTAATSARRFEVAAVYAPGIIIISSWVPGVLEAKSWGTRIGLGTTVGDAACRSMLIFVCLLYTSDAADE